jgi:hypothetical protein
MQASHTNSIIVALLGSVVAALSVKAETTFNDDIRITGYLRQGNSTTNLGWVSVTEGFLTRATGNASHAEGSEAWATNDAAHAEGYKTRAGGVASHAQGHTTAAPGLAAHSEGQNTTASGSASHAEGFDTVSAASASHSGGRWSRVLSAHTNAFIHATGSSGVSRKDTLFQNTGHFDRMILFEPANNHTNSVLARWENDLRYLQPVVTVTTRFESTVWVARQGDISMGVFTNGP